MSPNILGVIYYIKHTRYIIRSSECTTVYFCPVNAILVGHGPLVCSREVFVCPITGIADDFTIPWMHCNACVSVQEIPLEPVPG